MEGKNFEEDEDTEMLTGDNSSVPKSNITHNLDTGKDEVLPDINDEPIMDFGAGSSGGSAPAG